MADARGRRGSRSRDRRARRGDLAPRGPLLGDRAGRLHRRGGGRLLLGRLYRRAARGRSNAAAPVGGRRSDRPSGGGAARRAAARGCALRARPRAAISRRRGFVRVLDSLGACYADAVPGGTRARPLAAAVAARGGLPLPLEATVSADECAPLWALELHRTRAAACGRRHRHAARALWRRGRCARGRLRRLPPGGLLSLAAPTAAPSGSSSPGAGALDLARLRALPRLAERLLPPGRHSTVLACGPLRPFPRPPPPVLDSTH